MKHTQFGVTFLEILAVIAIISVLAVISFPTYTRMQMETRREEAKAAVVSLDSIIAQYLAVNNKYTFDSDDLSSAQFANYAIGSTVPVLTPNSLYRLTIETDSGGYKVAATATATGGLADCANPDNANSGQCADTLCREIAMYNGEKQSTDNNGVEADASTTQCW